MNDDILNAPLKLVLEDGDRYYDVPTPAHRSKRSVNHAEIRPNQVGQQVARAFGSPASKPIPIAFERHVLRWMKPDGKGGLVPRDGGKR